MRKLPFTIAAATLLLYAGSILLGLRFNPSTAYTIYPSAPTATTWHPSPIPASDRDTIAYGRRLFTETPIYASAYTPSRIACSNCHLGAGTAPFTAPVIGSAQAYPKFSVRSKRYVTLEDRIQECMTRSENGQPLPHDGPELHALLAYINFLSAPHPTQTAYTGRGLEHLPNLTPNPTHGAALYTTQCAGCHGTNGAGTSRPFPPLWGPTSFNDGAGMDTLPKLAAFIHIAMPQNRKGILSPQDAFDLAAYIHNQPHPTYNHANDRF
jgi:thiosulfate dehydrogenase